MHFLARQPLVPRRSVPTAPEPMRPSGFAPRSAVAGRPVTRTALRFASVGALLLGACGEASGDGALDGASGGAAASGTGGAFGTGGAAGTGGAQATGSAPGTGGLVATGGLSASGGALGTGGAVGSGGVGGGLGGAPSTGPLTLEENEPGFCSTGEEIEFEHVGFSGVGYVNTANVEGASLLWAIASDTAGSVTLTFRYASATDARPADLYVDDALVDSVAFAASGAWTTWAEDTAVVELGAGVHRIELVATTAYGLANVDRLTVDGGALAAASCEPTAGESCTPGDVDCLDADTPLLCDAEGAWQQGNRI